ncbi:MAG: 4Fe-4S dicluster domain-containing protein [Thermoleophilaceae bacterium]|nr:4Fe-4S dicluster domain-containing protein [Thermoleophilaceae bacterium]
MGVVPARYGPGVDPAREFVGPPSDPQDERVEVGVAIVGGGPAGLACAIRLTQLLDAEPELRDSLGEVPVALVEKGRSAGSHLLSGGVMRPSALAELLPDVPRSEWPSFGEVTDEAVYLLTKGRALKLPRTPPPFRNEGNHVVSVAQLARWLAERAEEAGVYVLPETAATRLLVEDGAVRGVRTGDKGRGRDGRELGNFEPGSDLVARATVLAEGTQGHLTGAAIEYFGLGSADPYQWELGVKEVWEVPKPLRRVIHTLGWPLRLGARYREFGGSWIYPMGRDRISLGFVAGLDYRDATFSVHDVLQQLKTHPFVRGLLEGGSRVGWGAKTIPSGGWWAMPERLWAPGLCLVGDGASMVNVPQLKGIHYAMHAGIYAAEAIVQALRTGSTEDLSGYDSRVRSSVIARDMHRSRNMRQPFAKGFLVGGAVANMMELSGGRFPGGRWHTHADAEVDVFVGAGERGYPKPDGKLTFDKLSSVYLTGNATRDDAPSHIRVRERVPIELALMWENMCPAQVYEVPEEARAAAANGNGSAGQFVDVKVTPSNCIQCGAITAKGGRLTPPEGGDGPNYQVT